VIAALIFGAIAVASPRSATAQGCPQPDVLVDSSVPEDGVLVITMRSPDGYVTGFGLSVTYVGGPAFLRDDLYSNPAYAEVRPQGRAGWTLEITVNSLCAGSPWVSDPVHRNVLVTEGTGAPPPPGTPSGTGPTYTVALIVAGGLLCILVLGLLGGRPRAVRCSRCGTRYAAGTVACPRDGTGLAVPPPPGWR